jgi:hypothetical protein
MVRTYNAPLLRNQPVRLSLLTSICVPAVRSNSWVVLYILVSCKSQVGKFLKLSNILFLLRINLFLHLIPGSVWFEKNILRGVSNV